MTFAHLLIFILATWRVSSLLVREAGPFHIFEKLRELTGITHDEDGNILEIPDDRFWVELLSCIWCCSIWVAIGWTVLWLIIPENSVWIALPFALSAGGLIAEAVQN